MPFREATCKRHNCLPGSLIDFHCISLIIHGNSKTMIYDAWFKCIRLHTPLIKPLLYSERPPRGLGPHGGPLGVPAISRPPFVRFGRAGSRFDRAGVTQARGTRGFRWGYTGVCWGYLGGPRPPLLAVSRPPLVRFGCGGSRFDWAGVHTGSAGGTWGVRGPFGRISAVLGPFWTRWVSF